jgi:hypothetical protein
LITCRSSRTTRTISDAEHAPGTRDLHRAHVKEVVMYHMARVAQEALWGRWELTSNRTATTR